MAEENSVETKVKGVEDIEKDNRITSVVLKYTERLPGKKPEVKTVTYPKDKAVRLLKRQKLNKGFTNYYTIEKVVRG